MISLRRYGKNISKVNGNFEVSESNKNMWYQFYYTYFLNLICNMYEWKGLPETIDPIFLEKNLNLHGYLCFFLDKNLGYFVQKGVVSDRLDIYDLPEYFNVVNNSLWNMFLNKKIYLIHYYNQFDSERATKGVLINNDMFRNPTELFLMTFCQKLAEIEQMIQLNRNAQNMPFVMITDENNRLTFKQMFNKVMEQEPVIYLKEQKNKQGVADPIQLNQRVQVLNTNTPFLLDKLHDEKQRVINQFLTFIGINNNAVDKAERLVSAEATANNGLINASIEMRLKSRKKSVELINRVFGLNIEVDLSTRISEFNTEKINQELEYPMEVDLYGE